MKRKWKKRILIIIGLFVIIGIALFKFAEHKEMEALNKKKLESNYSFQNLAFFAAETSPIEYAPYSTINLNFLQIYLNHYFEKTGIEITLSNVEEFLKDQYNKDGTSKTYKDDEGIIFDYVEYFIYNRAGFEWYVGKLNVILLEYLIENPEYPYRTVLAISLDSINELSKKHQNEEYQLNLVETDYFYQNTAFFTVHTDNTKYAPYSTIELQSLQIYLDYYFEVTGIEITLSDVEEFLKDQYKEDGIPKTYKDDEGVICDYIEYYTSHYADFGRYLSKLGAILSRYNAGNPECAYRYIRDVPLDLINELRKKYQDEEYKLILE